MSNFRVVRVDRIEPALNRVVEARVPHGDDRERAAASQTRASLLRAP